MLKVSWTVLSSVYKVLFLSRCVGKPDSVSSLVYQTVKQQMSQDDDVHTLAESLYEMMGVAAHCVDLSRIDGTTDVVAEIGTVSLEVASLIDEYIRHSFIGKLIPISCPHDRIILTCFLWIRMDCPIPANRCYENSD